MPAELRLEILTFVNIEDLGVLDITFQSLVYSDSNELISISLIFNSNCQNARCYWMQLFIIRHYIEYYYAKVTSCMMGWCVYYDIVNVVVHGW